MTGGTTVRVPLLILIIQMKVSHGNVFRVNRLS
jgi:hypothetical protein